MSYRRERERKRERERERERERLRERKTGKERGGERERETLTRENYFVSLPVPRKRLVHAPFITILLIEQTLFR